MSDLRRYHEEEIAEILRRATEADETALATTVGAGLTLAQIQEVGGEVGIAADRIERAA